MKKVKVGDLINTGDRLQKIRNIRILEANEVGKSTFIKLGKRLLQAFDKEELEVEISISKYAFLIKIPLDIKIRLD